MVVAGQATARQFDAATFVQPDGDAALASERTSGDVARTLSVDVHVQLRSSSQPPSPSSWYPTR